MSTQFLRDHSGAIMGLMSASQERAFMREFYKTAICYMLQEHAYKPMGSVATWCVLASIEQYRKHGGRGEDPPLFLLDPTP